MCSMNLSVTRKKREDQYFMTVNVKFNVDAEPNININV